MISDLSRIVPPAGASSEVINLCQQFNTHLAELELKLSMLQGSDGQSATLSSNLDLSGYRLKNVASPGQNSDAVSQSTLKRKGVYRRSTSTHLSVNNLSTGAICTANARSMKQPATKEQLQGLLASGSTVTTDVITALQKSGTDIQYKKRSISFVNGVATVGAESGWTTVV